jgi:hypothetical protein
LKKLLKRIGVDPKQYGAHSCRKDGCTAAALAGIEVRVLKRHGNWKIDAVYTYIHESIPGRSSVSLRPFLIPRSHPSRLWIAWGLSGKLSVIHTLLRREDRGPYKEKTADREAKRRPRTAKP